MKPKKRSRLRVKAGSYYFKLKRYMKWYFGNVTFASRMFDDHLPHLAACHATPLLRKLKNVDMWLQYNKIKNLQIAIPRLHQIVIDPGAATSELIPSTEKNSIWKVNCLRMNSLQAIRP